MVLRCSYIHTLLIYTIPGVFCFLIHCTHPVVNQWQLAAGSFVHVYGFFNCIQNCFVLQLVAIRAGQLFSHLVAVETDWNVKHFHQLQCSILTEKDFCILLELCNSYRPYIPVSIYKTYCDYLCELTVPGCHGDGNDDDLLILGYYNSTTIYSVKYRKHIAFDTIGGHFL